MIQPKNKIHTLQWIASCIPSGVSCIITIHKDTNIGNSKPFDQSFLIAINKLYSAHCRQLVLFENIDRQFDVSPSCIAPRI